MSLRIDFTEMTAEERLSLIDDLWESLSDEAAFPMSPTLGRELDRRVSEAHERPEEGRDWETIRSDLKGRSG